MASPVKPGGPTQRDIIDRRMQECRPKADLQEALDSREYEVFDLGIAAVRLIEADRTLPKYRRPGMKRIAWIMGVSLRSTYNWWEAYKKGGTEALRNDMWGPGPKPKVETEAIRGGNRAS